MAKLLEIRDLKTQFFTEDGIVHAVDGVPYDVEEGETLGLVGESGCGKSVTALSILRVILNPPGKIVAGAIMFEGEGLLKLDEDEVRLVRGDRSALVLQEPFTSLN